MSWYEYKPTPYQYDPDADSETSAFLGGLKLLLGAGMVICSVVGLFVLLFQ